MPAGYGEYTIRDRFNRKWEKNGFCIRIPQRRGDPAAISDLIAGICGYKTYSIEVKKVSNQVRATKSGNRIVEKPLEFKRHFSIAKGKIEFPHQLERQVRISQRMGWVPLLLLQVLSKDCKKREFLFYSADLLRIMKAGRLSVSASMFEDLHQKQLYEYLFKVDKASARKRNIEDD